jgi:hypothetical protein
MSTARDMIAASLRKIGALASGEALTADQASDGLSTLNQMLDSWSAEGLMIPASVRESFSLTPGTGSYTMGTGGAFSTSRPIEIEVVQIRDDATGIDSAPLDKLTAEQWAEITVKSTQGEPTKVYADGAHPLNTLNFYPVPDQAKKAVITSKKPLTQIAALSDVIQLPPGYERAIVYSLALELSPEYGRPVPDAVAAVAVEAKATLKRANQKPAYLSVDAAMLSRSGSFNIFTGGA